MRLANKIFPEFKYNWLADALESNIPKELDFHEEIANAERMR